MAGRKVIRGLLLFLPLLLPASPTEAQTNNGPSKCVGCHDHEKQARKWQKEEPAAFKGKAHYSTLKELDAPKSAQWAKAVGLADAYDVKGSCVKCHATVFRGEANAGVSCESCHGPSSKYNDLHQQKGSHAASVAAGLIDLKDKPPTIVKICVDCHVLGDKKLAAAGHPTGATFDAGVSLQKLVHWTTTYNYAAITAAGKAAAGGRAAAAGPAPPAAPPAAKAPAAAAPAGGEPSKAASAPAAAPAGQPAKAAGAAPVPAAPRPAAAAPGPPPAPWDWDQPARPLPDDYVPEPVAAGEPEAAAPAAAAEAPAAAPKRQRRAAPVVPPSLAEETPLPESLPGAAVTSSAAAAPPPGPAAPRPPAAEAVALRGEALQALEKLLRSGARTPAAPDPARPGEYSGPDGELLRLQDEVMALALEALRRPQ